jgi:hypothetical protein
LGLAAWALTPSLLTLECDQAVVNAPLVTIRSPIAGRARFVPSIDESGMLAPSRQAIEVRTQLPDTGRRDEFDAELATLRSRVEQLRVQLQTIDALAQQLRGDSKEYQEALIRRLEHLRDAAKSAAAQAEASLNQRDYERELSSRLVKSGSVSGLEYISNGYSAEAARQGVAQQKQLLASLEEELHAARAGVFIGQGDGRANLPYSSQRLHELAIRSADTRLSLRQDEARLASVKIQATAEEERSKLRDCFRTEIEGEIWRRHFEDGSTVTAGSVLVECLIPSEIFIDAVVAESNLTRIRPGTPALVSLSGSDESYPAIVTEIPGRVLRRADSTLALEALPVGAKDAHVLLSLKPGSSAAVGRSVRVSFQVGPPSPFSWLRR